MKLQIIGKLTGFHCLWMLNKLMWGKSDNLSDSPKQWKIKMYLLTEYLVNMSNANSCWLFKNKLEWSLSSCFDFYSYKMKLIPL